MLLIKSNFIAVFINVLVMFLSTSLFCRVMDFTRKNLNHFFPSLKKPSANVLSPGNSRGGEDGTFSGGGGAGPPAESDQSWAAVRCILSLLKAIISATDVK